MVQINKTKLYIFLVPLITIILIMISYGDKKEETKKVILISAASSLTVVLEEIINKFNFFHPDITVRVSYGGSGYLAAQIENGAPIDILISADERDTDRLIIKNIAKRESIIILCRNILVLAGFKENQQHYSTNELKKILKISTKIGIGNPDYVAAGLYAKNLLIKERLFAKYSQKFIQGNSVRQVVGWLESRDIDLAFIYKTDVLLNKNITIHKEYSKIGEQEIAYPALLTIKGESNPDAELFFTFLNSENSKNILTNYGFMTEGLNGTANKS
ncbi:MAG: molybdate ABC transporter substrate-binding protein [Spirochaetales bacterium]|nr:molybdate ABC transporter substrate-binding protein [Spirochaetales bacterium]